MFTIPWKHAINQYCNDNIGKPQNQKKSSSSNRPSIHRLSQIKLPFEKNPSFSSCNGYILLDLDQTLLFSHPIDSKQKNFIDSLESVPWRFTISLQGNKASSDGAWHFVVTKRPQLDNFLKRLNFLAEQNNLEVHVFSAGGPDYVYLLTKKTVEPYCKISKVLTSNNTIKWTDRESGLCHVVKPLHKLGYPKEKTVLIDDNSAHQRFWCSQKNSDFSANQLIVKPFQFDVGSRFNNKPPNDSELLDSVIPKLEALFSSKKIMDIRTSGVMSKQFNRCMLSYFEMWKEICPASLKWLNVKGLQESISSDEGSLEEKSDTKEFSIATFEDENVGKTLNDDDTEWCEPSKDKKGIKYPECGISTYKSYPAKNGYGSQIHGDSNPFPAQYECGFRSQSSRNSRLRHHLGNDDLNFSASNKYLQNTLSSRRSKSALRSVHESGNPYSKQMIYSSYPTKIQSIDRKNFNRFSNLQANKSYTIHQTINFPNKVQQKTSQGLVHE